MKKLSRESAIEQFGLSYVSSLAHLDFDMHRPTDLAGKLHKAATMHISSKILIVEKLGAPTQSFHFASVEDAAKELINGRRNHYAAQKEKLREMMQAPEAQAARAQSPTHFFSRLHRAQLP